MYCVNCGFKLEDSYKFCPECGNQINKSFVTITDVNPMLATMVMMSVAGGKSMNLFFLNGNFYKDKNCTMLFPLNNIQNNNNNNK